MAHVIPSVIATEPSWHGVPDPRPRPKFKVACERGDGTLNIHEEDETCDICSPTIREDETLNDGGHDDA
jgi:hypothetical protein